MNEQLATGDWAPPEEMAHWRDVVAKRAALAMGRDGGPATNSMRPEAKFPEASAKALYLLSETDLSKSEIARQSGLHRIQLDRLAMANAPTLEHRRPELAKKFTELAAKTLEVAGKRLERILENDELLDTTPLNHLAILAGVSIDKAGGLSNIPTSTIEMKIGLSLDDAAKMIEQAKAKAAAKLKGDALEAEIVA